MPVYEYQGKHYELSETDPIKAKEKIISATGGEPKVPESEETTPKKDLATAVFGKGPSAEMDIGERASRIGTAGLAGAAIGAVPGLAIGGPAGAAAGAGVGLIGGALGEIGEQAASYLGAGRGTQVATGLVSGGLADVAATAVPKAILSLSSGVKSLFGRETESPAVSAYREVLMRNAQNKLAGQGQQAAVQTGEEIQTKVAERQARAAELAQRAERAQFGEVSALRMQQERAAQELQQATEKGPGKTASEFDLGSNIRQDIEAVRDPQVAAMKSDYNKAYEVAMSNAQQVEAKGSFWGNQSEALDVKSKWKKEAKDSSEDVAKSIKKVINDIWKPGYTLSDGTQVPPRLLSAKGVDQIVRKLGEVGHGKEVSGYEGIGADVARNLRQDIINGIEKDGVRQGGFYNWSGLGPAKSQYASSLENLSQFESKRAQDVLARQEMGLPAVDAEKLPKNIFGTQSGLQEAKTMLPPEKLNAYAKQYAHNELTGKDISATRKWASEHGFLTDEFPAVQQAVDQHLNTLSSLESKTSILKERVAQAGEKKWSEGVDKLARKWVAESGVEGRGGLAKDPEKVVFDMLSGDTTRAQLQATSKYLNDVPAVKARFPETVAKYISQQSPKTIMAEIDRISPALLGSQLITPTELKTIKAGAADIIKASKAKPEVSSQIFELFKKGFSKKALGRSATRSAIIGVGYETPEEYKQ
jgi:hypothetical protein